MAPRSKIEDEAEAVRWIEEGRTYAWMSREHLRKYGVRVAPTTFSELRHKRGLPRRSARNVELIPWKVKPEHKGYVLNLLQTEGRLRAGLPCNEADARHVEALKSQLARDGLVIHYEPDTEEGWFYVPRREGIDRDIIRQPDRVTAARRPRR